MDYFNSEARAHYGQALETAVTTSDRRNAIYGDLIVSLDLNSPDAGERLTQLLQLDDGTAVGDVRIAWAGSSMGFEQETWKGSAS